MDSSLTQWQTLVLEASRACKATLSEDIESYLVFLLMRFTNSPQLAQKIMALEYLHSIEMYGSQRYQALRDVGDQCLLYSGLFPERARKRQVRVSYYVNIGQSAYLSLASQQRINYSSLFSSLAQQFVTLMDVLQSMREINSQSLFLDPIAAEEIWQDTGSMHALKTLENFSSKPIAKIYNFSNSKIKH